MDAKISDVMSRMVRGYRGEVIAVNGDMLTIKFEDVYSAGSFHKTMTSGDPYSTDIWDRPVVTAMRMVSPTINFLTEVVCEAFINESAFEL